MKKEIKDLVNKNEVYRLENEKKHYSYIDSPQIFYQFVENNQCSVIYNDYLDTGFENEWVFFIKKNEVENV